MEALQIWLAKRAAPPKAPSVNAIIDYYMEIQKYHGKARLDDVALMLRPIRAHFGALRPDQIKPAFVRDYTRRRLEGLPPSPRGPVSKRTVTIELSYLRAALRRAEKDEVIAKAPFIETPGGSIARKRHLTMEEVHQLLTGCAHPDTAPHIRLFVELALLTTQRSIAIKQLKWEHVDFARSVIWFSETGGATNKRRSDIPMTPSLRRRLESAREMARTEWVIEYRDKPVGSFKTGWRALVARSGLTNAHIHDLRRTAASLAVQSGKGMSTVAALLGDSIDVVQKHYAHFDPKYLQQAMLELDRED